MSVVKGLSSRKIPMLVPRKFISTDVTDWTSIKLKRSCTNVATALLSSNIQLELMMKLLGTPNEETTCEQVVRILGPT